MAYDGVAERTKFKVETKKDIMQYATKLEIGILGLMWCTGSQKAKANFLYKLCHEMAAKENSKNAKNEVSIEK